MTELADNDQGDDEAAYERECWVAIEECKNLDPPYRPTIWIDMVRRSGAANAARLLLASGDIQYGFQRLVDADRADLTIEQSALYPRWHRIFHEGHRDAARWRLQRAGARFYDPDVT